MLGVAAHAAFAVDHPADGPQVKHVCAVAPDVLMLTIQSGFHVQAQSMPYVAEPGDVVIEDGRDNPKSKAYEHPFIQDGKLTNRFDLVLQRNGTKIGRLSPDRQTLMKPMQTTGARLDATAAATPASFQIQSATDNAFQQPTPPTAVYRKCKPNAPPGGIGNYQWRVPFIHYIALKLPAPLHEGATYTIVLAGLNTKQEKVEYVHNPRLTRSDAVHASQIGYCPGDACKRAYLSIWLGADAKGQGIDIDYKIDSFDLVERTTGKTVYTGKAVQTKKKGDIDSMGGTAQCPDLDLCKSAVFRLDFSDFQKPGEYCVLVPGIGRSAPIRLASNVWEQPFRAALHSMLCQRSGIELKAPYSQWNRPRNFREEDGTQLYQIAITEDAGQEGPRGTDMLKLFKEGKLERVHGIWGAHEDAGDWDTLTHHLAVPYELCELYDMFPKYFDQIKIPLPENEAKSKIPNILAEAIWMLDGFQRLQLPDGGVRGGYGEPWGDSENATSWQMKCILVYAPNQYTSYMFAACAARAARVLTAIAPDKAAEYRASALRAWDWAVKHPDAKQHWGHRVSRQTAIVELYGLTRDLRFSTALQQDCGLLGGLGTPPDLLFAYARAPEGLLPPALQKESVDKLTAWADQEIERGKSNGFEIVFGLTGHAPLNSGDGFTGLLSTPGGSGGINMARVAYLKKNPKYAASVVQSCNYCFGANPMNLCYMTGVGWNSIQFPLKVDRLGGQLPPGQPRGYIPFGFQTWMALWLGPQIDGTWNPNEERMFPAGKDWPFQERYVDWAIDPCMNECCVDSGPLTAAYNTGFLMAREALGGKW
jgi:endoglucanase